MPSLNDLKKAIRRDATAYDKLAEQYNALIKKEQRAGHVVKTSQGTVTVANTPAGKAAGKRIVDAWNRVARKGQRLKAELEMYVAKNGMPSNQRTTRRSAIITRKPRTKSVGRRSSMRTYRRR